MWYSMIHPVARREHERSAAAPAFGPNEDASLKMRGNLETGERQHGRRKIEEADQLVAHRSRRDGDRRAPVGQRIISGTRSPES